jgi:chromosome segregation ATPase
MAACDRVLKFLDLEQERLDSDLVKASLIKEAAKDAVAAATSAGDDQRRQQHEVQKALQRAKQACTEQGRKAKALESEAALHEKAAAKAEAKAGKLPAAAASAARFYDDAVENSEKALKSALHALAAEETALREELRGLKRKGIGRSSSVIVNRGTLTAKVNACETLRGQVSGVYDAMSLLEAGLKSAVGTMKAANRRCFAIVRQSFNNQIARLLPGKRGVLEPLTRPRSLMTSGTEKKGETWKDGIDGDDENLEEGILMAIGSAANLKSRRSIAELSGGQKALVGLALTFALSSFRRLPLYVLDEIDAPLDEHNQGAAAEAVAEVLAGAQVLCVSHHAPFHRQADTIIQITRQNESSKLLRCVKQAGAGVKRSEPHGGASTSKSDGEQRRR